MKSLLNCFLLLLLSISAYSTASVSEETQVYNAVREHDNLNVRSLLNKVNLLTDDATLLETAIVSENYDAIEYILDRDRFPSWEQLLEIAYQLDDKVALGKIKDYRFRHWQMTSSFCWDYLPGTVMGEESRKRRRREMSVRESSGKRAKVEQLPAMEPSTDLTPNKRDITEFYDVIRNTNKDDSDVEWLERLERLKWLLQQATTTLEDFYPNLLDFAVSQKSYRSMYVLVVSDYFPKDLKEVKALRTAAIKDDFTAVGILLHERSKILSDENWIQTFYFCVRHRSAKVYHFMMQKRPKNHENIEKSNYAKKWADLLSMESKIGIKNNL